ncbi:MAG: GNAT family N-acetyltransferase [Caldisericaceae bacterium]|nr:GNAT family N-acetyltransferase [Caldisericaceae bacterium]
MELRAERLKLVLIEEEEKIKSLKKLLPDWQNLSERNWYPANMPDKMSFTIEAENKIAGGVELVNIRWFNRKAEITIWMLPEFRGRGLALQALQKLIKFSFEQLNFHRLEAEIYEFNQAARNLFTKLGFELEGKLREAKFKDGKYYDILHFGLLKKEWKKG